MKKSLALPTPSSHQTRRLTFILTILWALVLLTSCQEPDYPLSAASPSPSPWASSVPTAAQGHFADAWTDNFDAASLDASRWTVQENWMQSWATMPWRRNYKASNVSLASIEGAEDSKALRIQTIKETGADGTISYSTGCIQTGTYGGTALFTQTFGRFEIRVKFPTQQGHWPAFWLYADAVNGIDNSGRDGTEIDIFEKPWTGDKISHALHWDGYANSAQSAYHPLEGLGMNDGGWHTICLEWRPDAYIFSIDGTTTWTSNAGGVCQVPLWIILGEEIGWVSGYWGDGPIDAASVSLPDYFYVDWVKVSTWVAD